MTKAEKACTDMADVCNLAHKRTVKKCKERLYQINCMGLADCGDSNQEHRYSGGTHYSKRAQDIFNREYDNIINVTGL